MIAAPLDEANIWSHAMQHEQCCEIVRDCDQFVIG